jgi:hypothetical protein
MDYHYRQCEHTKPDGTRCKAAALHDRPHCFAHDPASAAKRDAARKAGGKASREKMRTLAPDDPDWPLATLSEVAAAYAKLANAVLKGQLHHRIGSTVGFLLGGLTAALKATGIEEDLAQMKEWIAEAERGKKGGKP